MTIFSNLTKRENIMRKFAIAFIAAAATFATAAHAEGGSAAAAYTTAAASASQVQIKAAAMGRYNMQPVEQDAIKGVYNLSDGHVLRLTQNGSRMYAEIDAQGKAELVALSANTLVGRDANIKIVFDEATKGFSNDVVVTGADQ